ncbi:Uncharacterised protein [Mycobacterium tuberculosis]|uniref:Uncharacterized protein n=1 Tax=Mycobacterium tuberculosis TaxID=1773 RepID=A0A916L7R7_MYCTX|nr:Uncharacterised protein [Mycobacterium tuberculosis]
MTIALSDALYVSIREDFGASANRPMSVSTSPT